LAKSFIKKCLLKDPVLRMTAQEGLRSGFILNYCGTACEIKSAQLKSLKAGSFDCNDPWVECEETNSNSRCYDENAEFREEDLIDKDIGIFNAHWASKITIIDFNSTIIICYSDNL